MVMGDIKPLLEKIGFKDIEIDVSNPDMRFEVEIPQAGGKVKKQMVQVGPEEFSDPQYEFNVNDYVMKVAIVASK